jgi:hypothetical protein
MRGAGWGGSSGLQKFSKAIQGSAFTKAFKTWD